MSRSLRASWVRLELPVAAVVLAAATALLGCTEEAATDPAGSSSSSGGDDLDLMLGAPDDPTTCAEAAAARSYLGCDFWPTVTFNAVWSIFDFAVVVANIGAEPAEVNLTGPGQLSVGTTVLPNSLAKIALPWIPELKGPEADHCSNTQSPTASVLAPRAAYHLTATRPVTVYQFNALEYRGAGGPQGKSWDGCPGLLWCEEEGNFSGCFSFTNDASLLLPTTALTGTYRVSVAGDTPGFAAITGTEDGTTVQVQLGFATSLLPGGPVTGATSPLSFTLEAGDVVQLASDGGSDLGGTLISADKPVQVIAGASCASLTPAGVTGTCDHLEESLQPAETLGKRYLLAAPTGPLGQGSQYVVRLVGNVDGTGVSYPSGAPPLAPATLQAGQVADLGIISGDFEIVADREITVSTFLASAIVNLPPDAIFSQGDPAQSQVVAVEQYRKSYVFLAPDDYDVSFVDVIAPLGAPVTLDDEPLPGEAVALGSSGFGVTRVRLGLGDAGAHSISADVPIGVQVIGYGAYTSYQYPAGLDLKHIAPPPPLR